MRATFAVASCVLHSAFFLAGGYGCSRGDIIPWLDVLYYLSKSLSVNNIYRQHDHVVTMLHIRWVIPSAFVESHTRDGREESITRVLLVTNELGWWTGKLEFAYTHTNKVF